MPTERKEPVIDNQTADLTDRVRLTWRDVRALAAQAPAQPIETAPSEHQSADAPNAAQPAETTPSQAESEAPPPAKLSPQEQAALTALLAPALENALRAALRETLELSLSNAVTRVRADLDRSVSSMVSEALARELSKADLSNIFRR